ncbi:uncharacterized protein [Miscanthus floridulus]|uniref:uncharacterized protein n=1 Tax=Miscanthus floridulus TaxID=154761 RepID=UPI003458D7E7
MPWPKLTILFLNSEVEEKPVTAAEADERRREEEVERLLKKVRRYSLFLYVGSMIVAIAPRLAPASRPAVVPSLPAGYGLPVTCASFTVATLVVQELLARVLERGPAPAPRLTPEAAWPLGISTWMFVTMFFHSYLCFGGDGYFVRSCDEWAAACVASSLNLFIATLTVSDYLA